MSNVASLPPRQVRSFPLGVSALGALEVLATLKSLPFAAHDGEAIAGVLATLDLLEVRDALYVLTPLGKQTLKELSEIEVEMERSLDETGEGSLLAKDGEEPNE